MIIYEFLRRGIIKHNTSVSDVSHSSVQNNFDLSSTTSPDNGIWIGDGEGDTNNTSFKEITMTRLDKLEKSVGRILKHMDQTSQNRRHAY